MHWWRNMPPPTAILPPRSLHFLLRCSIWLWIASKTQSQIELLIEVIIVHFTRLLLLIGYDQRYIEPTKFTQNYSNRFEQIYSYIESWLYPRTGPRKTRRSKCIQAVEPQRIAYDPKCARAHAFLCLCVCVRISLRCQWYSQYQWNVYIRGKY